MEADKSKAVFGRTLIVHYDGKNYAIAYTVYLNKAGRPVLKYILANGNRKQRKAFDKTNTPERELFILRKIRDEHMEYVTEKVNKEIEEEKDPEEAVRKLAILPKWQKMWSTIQIQGINLDGEPAQTPT